MPAIRKHSTATTDSAWDGPANEARIKTPVTKAVADDFWAWRDPDKDATTKAAYKFPHHEVDADGKPGAANVKACQSIISILNGGMGGSSIPDADRQGVYDHAAKHLKDAGETPAELKGAPAAGAQSRGPRAGLERRAEMHPTGVRVTRRLKFDQVELRATSDDGSDGLRFRGYASVTETPYTITDWLGDYQETVCRGAFAKTLSEGCDTVFLLNHEGMPLARTKSGTLQLSEDSHGLFAEASLDPANPVVQGVRSAMDRGDLDEMSFAFRVMRQEWNGDYSERFIREVSIDRGDVSVVTYGANPATAGASLRSQAVTARKYLQALHELRAGADLSSSTMVVLREVLDLAAAADENLDELQPLLADLMGVPNPDKPEKNAAGGNGDGAADDDEDPTGIIEEDGQRAGLPLDLAQALAKAASLRART